jgi:hypothetical protein
VKKKEIFPGDIISYPEMCIEVGFSIQRGMNFRTKNGITVILMSTRKGAPYADRIEEDGKVLIYEGHDVPKNLARDPKSVDQRADTPSGGLTENGKFFDAVAKLKLGEQDPEMIKVYEKIKDGIWAFNGVFELVDAWKEKSEGRKVFKYKLVITDKSIDQQKKALVKQKDLKHNRIIPTSVKLEVWKRDGGKCKMCGREDNLHFDHLLPFSKGGTSLLAENIQLLCARHNLQKHAKII